MIKCTGKMVEVPMKDDKDNMIDGLIYMLRKDGYTLAYIVEKLTDKWCANTKMVLDKVLTDDEKLIYNTTGDIWRTDNISAEETYKYYDGETLADIGMQIANEIYDGETISGLEYYINFEEFAQSFIDDGYLVKVNDHKYMRIWEL